MAIAETKLTPRRSYGTWEVILLLFQICKYEYLHKNIWCTSWNVWLRVKIIIYYGPWAILMMAFPIKVNASYIMWALKKLFLSKKGLGPLKVITSCYITPLLNRNARSSKYASPFVLSLQRCTGLLYNTCPTL